jgi:methylated-DNA-[protein]-cysteine S-methyltransferase
MRTSYAAVVVTPVGKFLLAASEKGLALVEKIFNEDPSTALEMMDRDGSNAKAMAPYIEQINEYFDGKRTEFTFPLDMEGTDFQLAAWYAMRNIPFGQTRSYAEIADRIGRPKAARAVGAACRTNKLAIVIPCHRVVTAQKTIGEYQWGVLTKQALLAHEGAKI